MCVCVCVREKASRLRCEELETVLILNERTWPGNDLNCGVFILSASSRYTGETWGGWSCITSPPSIHFARHFASIVLHITSVHSDQPPVGRSGQRKLQLHTVLSEKQGLSVICACERKNRTREGRKMRLITPRLVATRVGYAPTRSAGQR